MKLFSAITIAMIGCLGFVSAVRADTQNEAWLVLTHNVSASSAGAMRHKGSDGVSLATVPMKTMEGFQSEGNRWRNSKSQFRKGFREFYCLENK